MTAGEVRDMREREAKGSAVRQKIFTLSRVSRGLLALSNRKFEEAGRQFAEIGEEGGLNDWEGVVSPVWAVIPAYLITGHIDS